MATYKTPDVYIEEISVFPPSVAEVETAVPAFIGYTAKATRTVDNDLDNVPTKVTSLLEFESLFGGAPTLAVTMVRLDEANNYLSADLATSNTKYLYDSMRLFFDNGGGKCYIVSVGKHGDSTDAPALRGGLNKVAAVDEPTILLFPDAASLGPDDLASVQQQALLQCGKLKDRVAVFDLRNDDPYGDSFRDKIGINNLKYGAAYTPWLKLRAAKNVHYADVKSVLEKSGASVTLQSLTGDQNTLGLLNRLDAALADIDGMKARLETATGAGKTLASRFGELVTQYQGAKTPAHMQELFGYLYGIADAVDGMAQGGTQLQNGRHRDEVAQVIGSTLKQAYSDLIALEKELDGKLPAPAYTPQWDVDPDPAHANWGAIFAGSSPAASTNGIKASDNTDALRLDAALSGINKGFAAISSAVAGIVSGASAWRDSTEMSLYDSYAVYRDIVRGLNTSLTTCPPSGAVAGIYSLVDATRGVWKAPANVSLNGVIEPVHYFDTTETDALNVDTVAGKSVNAVRAFSGKGTLVWGARTLAGNDNEWRYISVRRFFNMVEESVKKSTYWAVFEPNDANTWVKVRGMIENYLTQKWREGALAGATTKEAYFVRCGLGVTMNAQDILEGRMNVEIGMAVVRPAEFIILKFSHKLQTS
jgi:phage tail sheath protein FI